MPIRETLARRAGTGIDGTAETFDTRVTILSSEQDSAEDRSTDENVRVHQEIDIQQTCNGVPDDTGVDPGPDDEP